MRGSLLLVPKNRLSCWKEHGFHARWSCSLWVQKLAPAKARAAGTSARVLPWSIGTDRSQPRAAVSQTSGKANGSRSATGFAAFRVAAGTLSGQPAFDYCWIRLVWTDPGKPGFPTKLTAIDWACNMTPNQPIEAGATSASVPEPSSLTLALLATGAAGVLAWRRRRQLDANSTVAEGVCE